MNLSDDVPRTDVPRLDAPRPTRTPAEHAAAILALGAPLPAEEIPADVAALGRVLAADVVALVDLPPWDNSAMDGYALRHADLRGLAERDDASGTGEPSDGGPFLGTGRLPVVDVVPAGDPRDLTLVPGSAVRIMTGAPVPAGADTVVQVERTDAGRELVEVREAVPAGANIRRRGEDVTTGEVVLRAGEVLTAARLGLAAATGHATLQVHARPRVLVVSTGSELVAPGSLAAGEPLPHGAIFESNSVQLAALARAAGADVEVRTVPDDVPALRALLTDPDLAADVVVTSGGVSVGEFDVVRDALAEHLELVHVRMQPGRPQASGLLPSGAVVVGLPGNPVSSYVSFEVFVRPLLRRLTGAASLERRRVRAALTSPLSSPLGKAQYVRVALAWPGGVPEATPVGGRGSHLLGALAGSDGLAVVPADVTDLEAGAMVDVLDLREDEA
ncbi:gephyrin-like molybdotransferase Glp [Sanguibacter sp. HDW7]|uniref:molybdopterin molybdotransferase MoeA n=1 Tax=Sanguibacter sp. HDW7 TaxID=2714931 RepID=UPI00140CE78E|nr:gephyrin-like molybdotransferase Glp [Sanguibacter sp. HDW7]QIK84701.1 molybdopterin molybdotransferase MoeA [Sanguibacter sp. HDW7]